MTKDFYEIIYQEIIASEKAYLKLQESINKLEKLNERLSQLVQSNRQRKLSEKALYERAVQGFQDYERPDTLPF